MKGAEAASMSIFLSRSSYSSRLYSLKCAFGIIFNANSFPVFLCRTVCVVDCEGKGKANVSKLSCLIACGGVSYLERHQRCHLCQDIWWSWSRTLWAPSFCPNSFHSSRRRLVSRVSVIWLRRLSFEAGWGRSRWLRCPLSSRDRRCLGNFRRASARQLLWHSRWASRLSHHEALTLRLRHDCSWNRWNTLVPMSSFDADCSACEQF